VALHMVESPAPEEVTLAEAAELLGVHPNTIRNRIRSGVYSPRKVPSAAGPEIYLIKREELAIPTPEPPPAWRVVIREALWSADPRRRRVQAIVWIVGGLANLCAWSFAFGRGWESVIHDRQEVMSRT
jgi:hypothetical protein